MKLCSNVCNRCRLVCVNFFKSEQICGCCCKMLSGSLFLGHTVYTLCHRNKTRNFWSTHSFGKCKPIFQIPSLADSKKASHMHACKVSPQYLKCVSALPCET